MEQVLSGASSLIEFGEALKGMMGLLALCALRIYVAFLIIPATNDQALQGTVRNGVCLTLAVFVAWGQPLRVVADISTTQLVLLLAKEALIGTLLGYAAAVVFWVAEGAGALIDNQAGYNNVQQSNPLSGEQSTPVSNLLSQLAISGFYMLGGMLVLAGVLFDSYRWWPLDRLSPVWSSVIEDFLRVQIGQYLQAVVKIAAPILLVLIVIDLGFGIIGKTADKLEPNNLSQPIKAAVAMAMLSLLVAIFFEQVRPMLALHSLANELTAWIRAVPR